MKTILVACTLALIMAGCVQPQSTEKTPEDSEKQIIVVGEKYCKEHSKLDEVVVRKENLFVAKVEGDEYLRALESKIIIVFTCNDGYLFIAAGPNLNSLRLVVVPSASDAAAGAKNKLLF